MFSPNTSYPSRSERCESSASLRTSAICREKPTFYGSLSPIYTSANCVPAYQLRWSLALFVRESLPPWEQWLGELTEAAVADGVHILESRPQGGNVWFFLLSTKPETAPPAIVRSIKGRLQHIVRESVPRAFRRNFSLTSIGDARRKTVEDYAASQLGHHLMADRRVEERLAAYQFAFSDIDLSRPRFSSHGRYIYNLHVVFVHDPAWSMTDHEQLACTRDMFLRAARRKRHQVSRLALLSDHLHATIGCNIDESPESVALSYLNNLAYSHGNRPVFRFGYYLGTFGEYDMNAIRWRRGWR